ncbi:MAG: hypothetical protein ACXWH5_06785 [Actinomycetota bacterium]
MIDQASEEAAHRLMAWVTLRKTFSREYLERLAGQHGVNALYSFARDLEVVPA